MSKGAAGTLAVPCCSPAFACGQLARTTQSVQSFYGAGRYGTPAPTAWPRSRRRSALKALLAEQSLCRRVLQAADTPPRRARVQDAARSLIFAAGFCALWPGKARRRKPSASLAVRAVLTDATAGARQQRSASRLTLRAGWSLFGRRQQQYTPQAAPSLLRALQEIYIKHMLPLEKRAHFTRCYEMPELTEVYFTSKPLVLVLGQYSTGKSTMLTKLLGSEYPGVRIGPEPTTDKFVAIMNGPSKRLIPGFALCSDPSKPFGQLQRFGSSFLERFEGAVLPEDTAPLLGSLCFVDTPGVLSGDKQRVGRSYDFEGAVSWFAENADMVVVMFDPNKLDVSDEFRRCLQALAHSERKVRFVLNKADVLDTSELVRVYGALMWSLSKVIDTPEMVHAFIGSFNNTSSKKAVAQDIKAFFEKEEARLLDDISQVPSDCTTRKVNDLLRRGRLLRAHALLVDHLAQNRGIFGGLSSVRKVLDDVAELDKLREEVSRTHGVPLSDFPTAADLRQKLSALPDDAIRRIPAAELADAEKALQMEVPALMERLAAERQQRAAEDAMAAARTPSLSPLTGGGLQPAASVPAAAAVAPAAAPAPVPPEVAPDRVKETTEEQVEQQQG